MKSRVAILVGTVVVSAWGAGAAVAQVPGEGALRATLIVDSLHVPVGQPIWMTFLIENQSDRPIRLEVPGTEPLPPENPAGLPIEHVFSGLRMQGLSIVSEGGRGWDPTPAYRPPLQAPVLELAAHASVGTRLEVTAHYPILRSAGEYRVRWSPYGGSVVSNELRLEVAPLKQAVIWTDMGNMTVRFFHEQAPNTIANFIELARDGFYDTLSFHRLEPGYCIMGGCPRGDGTGIRPDGRKLDAERSNIPQSPGMVSMSLLGDDPDSGSCQFFICNTRVPEWDGRYTVFGQLTGIDSFNTLDKLMSVPVDGQGFPERKLYIRSIRIVNAPSDLTPPAPYAP